MKHLTAAVVGTGFIGPVHVESLRRLGVQVAGVLGSSPEKSRRASAALGLPKAYDSLDELLADHTVNVVHLAVPNVQHYAMSQRVLAAGKHLMCEKPLAMNSRETAELVALAKTSGVAAGVCYNVRFYPLNLEARERIARGDLGRVFSISGSYVQDWLLHETDYNWRVLAVHGGELRAVADIGTHWIDLVTSITGLAVEAVFADLATVHPQRQRPAGEVETFSGAPSSKDARQAVAIDTEDQGNVLLRLSGGARANLHVSQVTAGRKNFLSYEIAGSKCALAWNSETPNSLWIGQRDGANQMLLRDPSLLCPAVRPFVDYPGGHNEGFPDTFKQCFRAFYEYIAAGNLSAPPPFATFADGHREVVLCEAILQSHREQRWVKV